MYINQHNTKSFFQRQSTKFLIITFNIAFLASVSKVLFHPPNRFSTKKYTAKTQN